MPSHSALRPRRPAARGEHFEPHVPGLSYGALDDLVGYAIRRAQILIYEDFVGALEARGITPQRFSALTLIAENDGMKLAELARALGIARSGAVQIVDQLQALGVVERRETEADRRAYALSATPEGRRALAGITRAVREHDKRISARLTAAQRRQLIELLGKLG